MDEATLLQQGIAAARGKRKAEAYTLLRQVVALDPQNAEAWIWIGAVAPSLQEQLQAFERAVALDPGNEKAQAGRRWAAGKLGAGGAAPPAPAASGGLSSRDMMGMFGGGPGGAAPPAPAGGAGSGLSSQEMMSMFGGMPGAAAAPPAPPAPSGSGGLSSQEMLNMFGGGAGTTAPPAPSGSGGLSAQEMMNMFGGAGPPAPPPPGRSAPAPSQLAEIFGGSGGANPPPLDSLAAPPTLPPGAPGTPGGAEWRGFSELEEPDTAFNWDDPGFGLGAGAGGAAQPPSGGFAWPETVAAPREISFAVAAAPYPEVPEAAAVGDAYAPALESEPTERRGTFSRLVLLGGVVLIVALVAVSLLLGTRLIPRSAAAGPDTVVSSFVTAHLAGDYGTAATFLAEPLRQDYLQRQENRLPGVPETGQNGQRWRAQVAPLAVAGNQAQVYAIFTPTSGAPPGPPVRFVLARTGDQWLITSVVSPPATP